MNWKAIVIGVVFYVILGTFFGNYFKAASGFIATVIIALITGVITALIAKRQFVRHGIWSGFLGGILIGITLVIMITSFPSEARILFPSDEIDALRNNIQLMFLMTTALFTIFGIIGSGIGSFITGLIYKKAGGKITEEKTKKESIIPSNTWWIAIVFGILGGIIGYIKLKNRNKKMAKNILIGGIIISIISVVIMTSIEMLNASSITDPLRKSVYGSGYATFSDGMVMEYPASWYANNYDFYPSSEPAKRREMKASITDYTYLLNKEGIYDTNSAVETWLEKDVMSFVQNPQLISKDLKEDVGIAKFNYTSQGKIEYAFLKIIKCNEKIFVLSIYAEEPKNLEYATEIDRMMSSFRCK